MFCLVVKQQMALPTQFLFFSKLICSVLLICKEFISDFRLFHKWRFLWSSRRNWTASEKFWSSWSRAGDPWIAEDGLHPTKNPVENQENNFRKFNRFLNSQRWVHCHIQKYAEKFSCFHWIRWVTKNQNAKYQTAMWWYLEEEIY